MSARHPEYRITIVISALDEEEVIGATVASVLRVLDDHFADYEVLLVNDGSKDQTGAIMNRLAADNARLRVIHNRQNEGLGAAYQRAIKEARFEYLMLLCGDGGLPASSLPPVFDAIGSADIIAPYMTNLRRIKTPMRFFMSSAYTGLLNLLFRQNIKYYNGLAIHRTDLLRQIRIVSTRFAFQGEVMIKLLKSGCSCAQIETLAAENTHKSSALRLSNVVNVLKTLLLLIWEVSLFDGRNVHRSAASMKRVTSPASSAYEVRD